jgi:hypothetical protein
MTWHDSPSPISDQAGERKNIKFPYRVAAAAAAFKLGAGSTLTSVRPHCVTLLFYFIFLKN